MSVELPFARYCPYLLESDCLSLSNNLLLLSGGIYDPCVGITHNLHPSGMALLTVVARPIRVSSLFRRARQQGLRDEEVRDILGFLNLIGWLQRGRSYSMWRRAICKQSLDLCIGVRHDLLVWRRSASNQTLCIGILRAIFPVLMCTILFSAFMQAGQLAPAQRIWSITSCCIITLLTSVYAHELSHLLFLRPKTQRIDVLQVGLRIGLLHKHLAPRAEIWCAVIGPGVGAAVCGVGAVGAFLLHQQLWGYLSLFIASFHVCNLVPWYGDGLNIRNALQARKST